MNITELGIASISTITVNCYLLGMLCKSLDHIPDKFIPVIMGICGAVLGVVAYFTKMPEFVDFHIITAIATGIVSGLAATGFNQIFKQINKEE